MPVIEVSENWSAQSLSKVPPWVAYREFAVTGTTDQDAACAASGVPQREDEHPRNAILTCNGPRVVRVLAPDHFHVGCQYTIDEKDDFSGDPLNKIAQIGWEPVTLSEPADRDLDNRPILNTAGFRLSGATGEIEYDLCTIMCFMPYFDHSLNQQFRGAVNANDVVVDGMLVKAQHMKCLRCMPAAPSNSGSRFVQMRFQFEVFFDDALGAYPFQHRLLDQGETGYYDDGGTKRPERFSNGAGELLTEAVRLDGSGAPLTAVHGAVKVGAANNPPISPLPPVQTYAKEFYNAAGTKSGALGADTVATFLYYKKCRVVDFAPLATLLNQKFRRQRE